MFKHENPSQPPRLGRRGGTGNSVCIVKALLGHDPRLCLFVDFAGWEDYSQ